METTNIAALVISVFTGIMIFFGVRGWWPIKPAPKAKSGPSATTTAGASGGTTTATVAPPPPPPAPTPAPAPTVSARSWGWLWSFVLVFFGGLVALTLYHKVLVPSFNLPGPPPQATAPKPQSFRQSAPFRTSAELVKSKSFGVEVENGTTKIRNSGKGLYFAEIPQKFSGTVYFKGYITRFYDGQLLLRVNGTEFQNLHKGGGRFWKVFSFPASVLHPGTNTFILSSPGEDILVEKMEIEVN